MQWKSRQMGPKIGVHGRKNFVMRCFVWTRCAVTQPIVSTGGGSRGGARRVLGEPAPKDGPGLEHVRRRVHWSGQSG
jgi:hypothetical protein